MDTLNLEQLKTDVHQAVLNKLDLEKLSSVDKRAGAAGRGDRRSGDSGQPQGATDRQRKGPDRIRPAR